MVGFLEGGAFLDQVTDTKPQKQLFHGVVPTFFRRETKRKFFKCALWRPAYPTDFQVHSLQAQI
jgi:hypothetical protein